MFGWVKEQATATAKTKYRDLSAAAAKAPPSVEMTFVVGWDKEQATATAIVTATATAKDELVGGERFGWIEIFLVEWLDRFAPILAEIAPCWVLRDDETDFLDARPALQLFLASYG